MGVVYLVEDPRLQRKAAIKLLPGHLTQEPDRVSRFEQEARVASALNHPNIITIYDIGQSEAGQFIAMEFVAGRTLRALGREAVDCGVVIQWSRQIAQALAVAHAAGIVHRDIKPENVMVRDDGLVKLLDFGIAQLDQRYEDSVTAFSTTPGDVLGTVRYMSPEQARGERVGTETDMFALGVVLYELTTGSHPFPATTLAGAVHAIAIDTPRLPSLATSDVPPAFEELVMGLLAKNPARRPTASEAAMVLASLGTDRAAGPRPGERVTRSVPLAAPRVVFVGRDHERALMRQAFDSASQGRGRLLTIAGEPGIGKTSLVDVFLSDLGASEVACRAARGRCSERVAGTEAYLPWLEALDALRRGSAVATLPAAGSVERTLRHVAPTWYAQLAPLTTENASDASVVAALRSASQERMKRELSALLEELSSHEPLVLVFEDLHWADVSTIDMLAFVGSRLATIRALIVVTYRPSDLQIANSPFIAIKHDLQARGICRELPLDFLGAADTDAYLAREFPGHRFPDDLRAMVHVKTEGNPLFMVDLVRYLRDRGVIALDEKGWVVASTMTGVDHDLPESMRGMIERKLGQLSADDRRLLVAASVQGYRFDSTVVAAALGVQQSQVEERLEALDTVFAFVRQDGDVVHPDGTLTLTYHFVHILYQEAFYASLRPTRRAELSTAVAAALRRCHNDQVDKVAVQLAVLHEVSRDFVTAAEYYLLAARNATQVFADHESVALARRGLNALKAAPDSQSRGRLELALGLTLSWSLINTRGYAAPEVEQTYTRAISLCSDPVNQPELYRALWGLAMCHLVRAEFTRTRELAVEILRLAQESKALPALATAHYMLGTVLFYLGELVASRDHYVEGVALGDANPGEANLPDGRDPSLTCRAQLARLLWLLGYPDQALDASNAALKLASEIGQPLGIAFAHFLQMLMRQMRGEPAETAQCADRILALAREHDLPQYRAWAVILHGWAQVMQGDEAAIVVLHDSLVAYGRLGSTLSRTHFLGLLAEGLGRHARVDDALGVVGQALTLVETTNERYYEAALHTTNGELLLQQDTPGSAAAAERCFEQAIVCARQQHAKSLGLRASLSLARLWQGTGRSAEAHAMLSTIYGSFTEGFDTRDLQEARQLLDRSA